MKIALIDSGVSEHLVRTNTSQITYKDRTDSDGWVWDENGHGTAVCSIICKINPNVCIDSYKIYREQLITSEDILVKVLDELNKFSDCDIVHMSLGTSSYSTKLQDACTELYEKGKIVVAAFANEGYMSYPASFKNVIGVDSSDLCKRPSDFIIREKGNINVYARGGFIVSQGLMADIPFIWEAVCLPPT